jgi:transposase-like protein
MGETQDRTEALRLKLARSRDSRRRVPGELRAEAVAFAKAEHASGQRYKSIARTLGLKADSLMSMLPTSRSKLSEPVVSLDVVSLVHPATPTATTRQHRIQCINREVVMNDSYVRSPPRARIDVPVWGDREVTIVANRITSVFDPEFLCNPGYVMKITLWAEPGFAPVAT